MQHGKSYDRMSIKGKERPPGGNDTQVSFHLSSLGAAALIYSASVGDCTQFMTKGIYFLLLLSLHLFSAECSEHQLESSRSLMTEH